MKRSIFLITLSLLSSFGFAQTYFDSEKVSSIPLFPCEYVYNRIPNSNNERALVNVIWEETFEDGIPETWGNSDSAGVAMWEYRGALTEPNFYIGSRGACNTNSEGPAIESPSWDNGFVIFDSNWWDAGDNPCNGEFFGAGLAPGPHLTALTTNAIDLSGYDQVAVIFAQYCKNYQSELRLEISTDSSEWVDAEISSTPWYIESAPDDEIRVDISEIAGGSANVWLRFVFQGFYYWCMIDDIQIIELVDNDVVMLDSGYGDFDFFSPVGPSGYEYLEYSMYPNEIDPIFKFNALVSNYGKFDQTGIDMNIKIKDASEATVYSNSTTLDLSLSTFEEGTLDMSLYTFTGGIGKYTIDYEVVQNEIDEVPDNNFGSHDFEITEHIYARDMRAMESYIVPNSSFNGQNFEIGNYFLINNENQEAYSVSVGLAEGTDIDMELYGVIYRLNIYNNNELTLMGQTPPQNIDPFFLNETGEENMNHFYFDSPIALEKDSAYIVLIGSSSGPEGLRVGLSGTSEIPSSLVKVNADEYYFVTQTPMVRLNLGPVFNNVSEVEELKIEVFPNPASDRLNLSGLGNGRYDLKVIDQMGREVINTTYFHPNSGPLDISTLKTGIYSVSIKNEDGLMSTSFIKH